MLTTASGATSRTAAATASRSSASTASIGVGPGCGVRASPITSCPADSNSGSSGRPITPLAPATSTFMIPPPVVGLVRDAARSRDVTVGRGDPDHGPPAMIACPGARLCEDVGMGDWLADAVVYEIYPQSFADSDGD